MHRIYHHQSFATAHKWSTLVSIMRGDLRHVSRLVFMTIASIAVYNMGWGFADPYFSVYLSIFGDNYALIGLFQTVLLVITVITLIPAGELLDRTSHRTLVNGAKRLYVLVGSGYIIAGVTQSTPLLLVTLALNGLLIPFVWTGTSASLRMAVTKKNATLIYGLFITARQVAFALGLLLSLVVVDRFPIYTIYFPVIFFILLSIPLFPKDKQPREPLFRALREIVVRDKVFLKFFRTVRKFPSELWCVESLVLLVSVVEVVALLYIPLFALEQGFSILQVGLLLVVMNIPYLLSFIPAEIADHTERLRLFIIGTLVAAVALVSLVFWHEEWWHIALAAAGLTIGQGIAVPAASAVAAVVTPKRNAGIASALLDSDTFIAFIVFAPLIGVLIDAMGWDKMLLVVAVLLILVAVLATVFRALFLRRNHMFHALHPKSNKNPYIV